MNKTVYVRDEEVPVWERAKELAGDKLSRIIASALKRFVAEKEAQTMGFERIEYEFADADSNGRPRKVAFYGRWIFPPDKPAEEPSPNFDPSGCGVLATTAKGAVVACTWIPSLDSESYQRFRVYPSFEAGAKDSESRWIVYSALQRIGAPVEELDI